MILAIIAVFASVLIIKNHLGQNRITKPDFTIVLKESIYIEYGVDVYSDDTLLNIIESHVIDELKSEVHQMQLMSMKLIIVKHHLII